MAEGLLRHLAKDRFEIASAGTHPVGLHLSAVEVMKEIGIDIGSQRSKSVEEFLGQRFDYVITVCDRARESCPTFPASTALLHWSFEDPVTAVGSVEERRKVFQRVRNEIADRVRQFVDSTTARSRRSRIKIS